jgi:putative NADH-flavin reductase
MKVAVFGATGGTGTQILPQAIERGHHIVALARNPSALNYSSEDVTVIKGDVGNIDDVRNTVRDCEAVIVALGVAPTSKPTYVLSNGVKNVVACMKEFNIKRLIVVTTAGINHKNEQHTNFIYRHFVRRYILRESYTDHTRVEKFLEQNDSSIEWTIVQSPYITGDALSRKVATKVGELPDMKNQMVVSYADLAYGMLEMLDNNTFVLEKVGIASTDPATSLRTMFQVIYNTFILPNKQRLIIVLLVLLFIWIEIRLNFY